jgi:uncharacterized protein YdaL
LRSRFAVAPLDNCEGLKMKTRITLTAAAIAALTACNNNNAATNLATNAGTNLNAGATMNAATGMNATDMNATDMNATNTGMTDVNAAGNATTNQ